LTIFRNGKQFEYVKTKFVDMANENEETKKENIENQEEVNATESNDQSKKESDLEQPNADETTESAANSDESSVTSDELNEMKDKYLRLQAEFENYRKRTVKEKADLISYASEKVLLDLLPVIDDLDRAMDSVAKTEDVVAMHEGLELIVSKFQGFLKKNGVVEIEAKEQSFDADKHEAVTKFPSPSEDMKGKVIDVIQKGYTLNGKVMRYAKVVVGE